MTRSRDLYTLETTNVITVRLGARLSNAERAPSRRATRARIRQIIGVFAGEAGLLGACSCFPDTLLEPDATYEKADPTVRLKPDATYVKPDATYVKPDATY